MGANSLARRVLKRVLAPLMNEGGYRYVQSVAKAWDIRRGTFTEPELDLLPVAIRPGETVLDVGANFGMYSYHLSKAVGPSGKVFAFEPIPFTNGTLRLVAKHLGFRNVEIVPKGCGDHTGPVVFRVPVQKSGALMTGQAHIGARDDDRGGKEEHVLWERTAEVPCEIVALDEFLPPIADLSFVKCDVEGAELFAFRGAEKTIDRHLPTVLSEVYPWCLEGFGYTLEDLTGFFYAKGYGFYHYDRGARTLSPVTDLAEVDQGNYLFIHPRRRDRFAGMLEPSLAARSAS